jgi:outer membrane protein TolC
VTRKPRFLLAAFCAVSLLSAVAPAAEESLSPQALDLPRAVEMILSNSPGLAILREQIQIEQNTSRSAEAARYPTLLFDSTLGAGAGASYENQSLRHSTGLSISAPLFDGGKQGALIEASRHQVSLRELALSLRQEELIYSLVEDYSRLSLLSSLEELRSESLKLLTRQRDSLENSLRQGLRMKSDFLSADLEVKLAKTKLDELRFRRLSKIIEIREKVGQEDGDDREVTIPRHPVPFSKSTNPDSEGQLNVTDLLEFRLLERLRQQEQLNVAGAKLARRPDVNAKIFAGVRNDLVGDDFFSDRRNSKSAEASVSLEYPLWDWGIRERQVMNAITEERIAALRFEEGRLRLRRLVSQLAIERQQLKAGWDLARSIQEQARASYEAFEQSYRLGRASFSDLVAAHLKFMNSREALLTSEIDLYLKMEKELMLKGKLSERFFNSKK